MTIYAYREYYLSRAQSILGEAFDYAVNVCGIAGDDFSKIFAVSSLSRRMENGEPAILMGKSGVELALDVIRECMGTEPAVQPYESLSRSAEYWIGWAVAWYQWRSDRRFLAIFQALPFEELHRMYYTLHEADVSKFGDIADARMKAFYADTNLKRLRTVYGCSQSALAKLSGVSLRSIQMYEQRNKDINKASAETVYRLAKTLGCTVEDLLER